MNRSERRWRLGVQKFRIQLHFATVETHYKDLLHCCISTTCYERDQIRLFRDVWVVFYVHFPNSLICEYIIPYVWTTHVPSYPQ
jgi:hypothetical protein